ncbi:Oxygen sensor histidine kinase response regulator DosT [Anaerolineales bacterium]|nr:Oxygen sensor histidine kinase response regulator DosT [Anaerolineales bacterium]
MRFLEYINNLKLGAKLNILAFAIFSFLLLGMVLSTNNSMNSFVLQAGHQNIIQDAQTIQTRFDEIEQETLTNAIALSNSPGLQEAISTINVRPIQSELLIAAARLDFDDMDLLDAKGRHLLGRADTDSLDEDRLTRLALLGFNATGLVVKNKDGVNIFITAVVPIHDASGATIGAVLGSRLIDDEMLSRVNVFSGHSLDLALIVDGQIVASDFEEGQGLEHFSPLLLDPNSIGQVLNGQTVYREELIANPEGDPHALGHTPLTIGSDTKGVIGLAVNMGELADIKSQLISNQRAVFAFFAIIGNIILALFAAHGITNPIRRLQLAADQLAKGDYAQRVFRGAKDEIWHLTNSFNSMAAQIQGLVTGLEERVAQRTSELEHRSEELEKATEQSKKRANELQTIAEIAQYLSTEKELELLLPLITRTVSERFGFYHVGIFLLNETGNYAVLRAANSPGGQKMLARQHKLEVGQVGIVGNVTSTGIPRIALDTGSDATYFNNPDLPETHSEMALPLIARGKVVGALDVQSTVPNAFTEADAATLGLLADQIAIAIDNVRLLEETQNALEESRAVFREYVADSWQKKSTSGVVGYHQTLVAGQVITADKIKEVEIPTRDENGVLTVPIKLRDQVIGTLNIRPNTEGKSWNADEVNIVQAVTERLGLALDNARLFEETSSRAARERLVSDITTKIRSTTDPQEMVKTAVEELKRALGVTRVEIIPQKTAPPPEN